MAYEGEILNACGAINIDLSDVYIVAVSGDGPNIFVATYCYTQPRVAVTIFT